MHEREKGMERNGKDEKEIYAPAFGRIVTDRLCRTGDQSYRKYPRLVPWNDTLLHLVHDAFGYFFVKVHLSAPLLLWGALHLW